METIHRDYSTKGVKFYYIYKALAHPETNGYITPFTLEERLMHVQEAERTLGTKIPWICDTMENDLKHALGDAPNSEFIIDPQGKVAVRRSWSDPSQLRRDLERLVGPIARPTTIASLDLKKTAPHKAAPSGIVKRLELPGPMQALKIEPRDASGHPYYAKLRAEVDAGLLRSGNGKLYLGFHLDPLYHVHWNNLAAPLKYEVSAADGVSISPPRGEAARVEQESDVDPREFLLDIQTNGGESTFEVTVSYFACNDDEGWCKPVSQTYKVELEVDRDGGWPRRGNAARPASPPARRPEAARPNRAAAAVRQMGSVVEIDADQRILTIETMARQRQELLVPERAQLMRDGRGISLADLQTGDRVMFEIDASVKDDAGRPHVRRLMSRN